MSSIASSMRLALTSAFAAILLLGCLPAAHSQYRREVQGQGGARPLGQIGTPPPAALLAGTRRRVNVETWFDSPGAKISGSATYDMEGRRVNIQWARRFMDVVKVSEQSFATTFFPTELCVFRDGLCVAGKRGVSGYTVIEVWEFGPQELPDAYVDPSTGATVHPDTELFPTDKFTIYDEKTPGRKLVRFMFRNAGSPIHLLVQFWDSKDLYEIDTTTGEFERIMTVDPLAGDCEYQPELADTYYNDRWSADMLTFGYVYFLFDDGNGPTTFPKALMLVDADRDGVLDSGGSMVLGHEEWASLHLSDGNQYVEVF